MCANRLSVSNNVIVLRVKYAKYCKAKIKHLLVLITQEEDTDIYVGQASQYPEDDWDNNMLLLAQPRKSSRLMGQRVDCINQAPASMTQATLNAFMGNS